MSDETVSRVTLVTVLIVGVLCQPLAFGAVVCAPQPNPENLMISDESQEEEREPVAVCPTVTVKQTTSSEKRTIPAAFDFPANGDIYGLCWCSACGGAFSVANPCRCSGTLCGYMGRHEMCDFIGTVDEVRQHREEEHGAYRCTQCDASFALSSELAEHKAKRHAPESVKTTCMLCGETILAIRALKHLEQRHSLFKNTQKDPGNPIWNCPFCQEMFKTSHEYTQHVSTCRQSACVHGAIAPLVIEVPRVENFE